MTNFVLHSCNIICRKVNRFYLITTDPISRFPLKSCSSSMVLKFLSDIEDNASSQFEGPADCLHYVLIVAEL